MFSPPICWTDGGASWQPLLWLALAPWRQALPVSAGYLPTWPRAAVGPRHPNDPPHRFVLQPGMREPQTKTHCPPTPPQPPLPRKTSWLCRPVACQRWRSPCPPPSCPGTRGWTHAGKSSVGLVGFSGTHWCKTRCPVNMRGKKKRENFWVVGESLLFPPLFCPWCYPYKVVDGSYKTVL